jgi:hypothetical protein
VELHDTEFRLIMLQRLTNAEFRHAAFAGRVVIALEDNHVAAITTAPVKIASSGGALTDRRHHFEKLIAHREHRVLQSEGGNCRVAIGDLQAENITKFIDHGSEFPCNQHNLSHAQPHGISSF